MEKILVCLNDGLLKIRIKRILSEKNLSFEVTSNPINRNDLLKYSLIVIHSSYKLTNLIKFIENAVANSLSTFIYISSNPTSNKLIHLKDNPKLILVDENKMDVELNFAINMYRKIHDDLDMLRKDNIKLKAQLESEKLLTKCKRILITNGLTEDQAHKQILKYAMDNKISKDEACKRLISENN